MDLCGPMRVESINGNKYVLVIIDDYLRNTWTHFLRSKDETPEVLIDFPRFVQRGLHAHVRIVRTNKGMKFLNKTLHEYFSQEGIEHQTPVARTPKQNGVVKRQNRTVVKAARTMLSAAKSLNELDILFCPMFDEYFNGATIVVSKSLAIPTADTSDQRQQPNINPSTSTTVVADQTQLEIHSTPKPITLEPTVIATENIDQAEDVMVDEDEFFNIFSTPNKRDEENTVILNKARLVAKDIVKQKELILKSHLYQLLDSDHVRCLDTRKSTSGGIPFLGGDKLVSWSSKKKDCTSMSTAEAEYMSLSMCCVQVFWMRTQLTDYGFHFDKIPMYCDSKAAIAISCSLVQHSRTKHIDVRYHFIKEQVESGIVELFFVRTKYS
ncbi:retrovirus-related pol polyprotein from transposon TNT 1-94 [Tanacetum coccineum]